LDDVFGTSRTAQGINRFKDARGDNKDPYKPEDLTFATHSMQPSTVG